MACAALLDILSRNKDTEIGKKLKFSSIHSVETWQKRVPLSNYDDYKPYINRMVENCERNLLTPDEVIFYAPTSGTTSESKLLPRFKAPRPLKLSEGKTVFFMNCSKHRATKHGIPIISGYNAVLAETIATSPSSLVAPKTAFELSDLPTSIYVQLVFGLNDKSVKNIWAPFCPIVLTAFKQLQSQWREIVFDIQHGKLKENLDLSTIQRELLESCMLPNPERADELGSIFQSAETNNFKSVAKQLWPDLVTVDALAGGTLASYIPLVTHFLDDHVCLFSSVYAASEGPGLLGINKEPNGPAENRCSYSLNTDAVFFEFIAVHPCNGDDVATSSNQQQPDDVLTSQNIVEGAEYEIVLTTFEGLYRYRIGDVIKVVKKANPPVIELLGRSKTFSLFTEKLTDFQIFAAIKEVCKHFSLQIEDFILTADLSQVLPRHHIWLEIACYGHQTEASAFDTNLGESIIDKHLSQMNMSYANIRKCNFVLSPKISLVKSGTFNEIRSILKRKSQVNESQQKVPRTTNDSTIIAVLAKNTI